MSDSRSIFYDFQLNGNVISVANDNTLDTLLIINALMPWLNGDDDFYLIVEDNQVQLCCFQETSQAALEAAFLNLKQKYSENFLNQFTSDNSLSPTTIIPVPPIETTSAGTLKNANDQAEEGHSEGEIRKVVSIQRDVKRHKKFQDLTFYLIKQKHDWYISCDKDITADELQRFFRMAITTIEKERPQDFPIKVCVRKGRLTVLNNKENGVLTDKEIEDAFEQAAHGIHQQKCRTSPEVQSKTLIKANELPYQANEFPPGEMLPNRIGNNEQRKYKLNRSQIVHAQNGSGNPKEILADLTPLLKNVEKYGLFPYPNAVNPERVFFTISQTDQSQAALDQAFKEVMDLYELVSMRRVAQPFFLFSSPPMMENPLAFHSGKQSIEGTSNSSRFPAYDSVEVTNKEKDVEDAYSDIVNYLSKKTS